MPDVFTKQKRSEVMSRIRSRGNKRTELAAVEFFRRNGITGWRRHSLLKFKGVSTRAISKPAARGDARPTRLTKPSQTSLTSRSSREQAGPAPNATRGRRGLH